MCSICSYEWDHQEEQKRRMEEEEFIEHPCHTCGGEGGNDGPVNGFCSRSCLREWNGR